MRNFYGFSGFSAPFGGGSFRPQTSAKVTLRQEGALTLGIPQEQWVKARQDQDLRDGVWGLGSIQGENGLTPPGLLPQGEVREQGRQRPLGSPEEMGGVPEAGGAVVGEVAAQQLPPGGVPLQGDEIRAAAEDLAGLGGVADLPGLAEGPGQAAPGVEEVGFLLRRHAGGAADGLQLLPEGGTGRKALQYPVREVGLPGFADHLVPRQGVAGTEEGRPARMEEEGQVPLRAWGENWLWPPQRSPGAVRAAGGAGRCWPRGGGR